MYINLYLFGNKTVIQHIILTTVHYSDDLLIKRKMFKLVFYCLIKDLLI